MTKKIGIISLGCARNLVDSEIITGRFKRKGYRIVDLEKADIALVNTCAFIKEAKEESINTILDLIELKKNGKLKKIIVAGCLTQRYRNQLLKHLPEVDAFQGTISLNHTQDRFRMTPKHYAYLKICDGCISKCSFCAIPNIKPDLRSHRIESIISQLKLLGRQNCREVNLIGQDITAYGYDLYAKFRLVDLIKRILKHSKRIDWIRLLYLAPERISRELIDVIASSEKIVKYIDLPLQHINDRILKLMNRKINSYKMFKLIDIIRKKIPNVAIRTSLIVGFPTETEKEFNQLLKFIRDVEFERLGMFIYSREEGTKAFGFKGQIPQRIKEVRYNAIMSSQQDIARKINQKLYGQILRVLIESKEEDSLFVGRSEYDAPEVDGEVFVKSDKHLSIGDFTDVRITDTLEYDLVAEAI